MNQEAVPRERRVPPNSRVVRRLDFGGDNFEADLENFINLTTEVVQIYSEKYNFDFTNEIAYLGRYLWSRPDKRAGWVSMEIRDHMVGNEITPAHPKTIATAETSPTVPKTVAAADMSPTHPSAVAAAAEKTPMRSTAATAAADCDQFLRKRELRDDKTSEKKKMPGDDKTSKKRKMSRDVKSQVKKRLTME